MRPLRNPIGQFLLAGLIIMGVITFGTSWLAARAAEQEALAEARDTNQVLTESVVKPAFTQGLVKGKTRAIDLFDVRILDRLLIDQIVRVNIWSADGRLIYSSAFALMGSSFDLSEGQLEAMRARTTGSEISDPDLPQNRVQDPEQSEFIGDTRLVQIYTGFRKDDSGPLLFETYYALPDIEVRRQEIFSSFRWIAIGGPLALLLLVTPILVVLTRQLTRGAKERERLLHTAIDASDAERRRIARDLHDSVVQDLAGTAFSVSAVARDPRTPLEARAHLEEAGSALRDNLKSLRSLLAEIHPPELHSVGLAAALEDLIAPAGAAGVQASVSVEGAETVSDPMAALVWRVAQEAVRNALRHARASTLAVTVRADGRKVSLEVVDDGIGFDLNQPPDPNSFGLRGLRSLVAETHGILEVRSSPGEGTTVHMEVDAR